MKSVRLHWKPRLSKRKRAATLKWTRRFYATARDRGEYLELLAGKNDTKFIWLFMMSKAFKDIE